MQDSIVSQGIDLMLYGMGAVFAFLTLMVFALMLLARIVKAFPGPKDTQQTITATAVGGSSAALDPAHLKAIE